MHNLEKIRELGIKQVIKSCEQTNRPLIFWDLGELGSVSGLPLPTLQGPVGWNVRDAYVVDLENADQVGQVRADIRTWIKEYEDKENLVEVGFAIVGQFGTTAVVLVYTTV